MDIFNGDCLVVLKQLADNSVDSVVTDPPYGLNFMNKHWDYDVPSVEIWKEVLRVLKPGGQLLSFGGTRTYHRMVVNIEDAGFEIRDQIQWLYGSGFPKSLNIGKAIDKVNGDERVIIGNYIAPDGNERHNNKEKYNTSDYGTFKMNRIKDKGTSDWEGWGTALKPANEPICLARKPISENTIAENVLKWGTGGINIDGCRVEHNGELKAGMWKTNDGEFGQKEGWNSHKNKDHFYDPTGGRFPANVIHDGSEEVLERFPYSTSGAMDSISKGKNYGIYGKYNGKHVTADASEGSASRFFYCAKASKSERNKGVDNMEKEIGHNRFDKCSVCGGIIFQNPDRPSACKCENPQREHNTVNGNFHPTVKPISLMRYLCRLITPPKGIVLDPFMGSGSTGIGAKLEGFDFVGIEREDEYCKIAKARIDAWEVETPAKVIIEPTLF